MKRFGEVIPDEVVVHVVSFVDMKTLKSLSLCCYRYYRLCSTDFVWKRFSPPTSPVRKDFKKFFVNDQIMKSNFGKSSFKHIFLPPVIKNPHILRHHEHFPIICSANEVGSVVFLQYGKKKMRKRREVPSKYLKYKNYSHRGKVKCLLFPEHNSPPEYVFSGGSDGRIIQHDISSLYKKTLKINERYPTEIGVINTKSSCEFLRWMNHSLFCSTSDGRIRLYAKKKNSIEYFKKPRWNLQTFKVEQSERLLNFKIDIRSKRLYCHTRERVRVYDIRQTRNKTNEHEITLSDHVFGSIGSLRVFPNNPELVLVSAKGRLIRLDLRDKEDPKPIIFIPNLGRATGTNYYGMFSSLKFHPSNPNICFFGRGRNLETIDFRKPIKRGPNYFSENVKTKHDGIISKIMFDTLESGEIMMFSTSSLQQELCMYKFESDEGKKCSCFNVIKPIDVFGSVVKKGKLFACGRSNIILYDFVHNQY